MGQRYVPGQKVYLEQVRPAERADVVIQNDDWQQPRLVRARSAAEHSCDDR